MDEVDASKTITYQELWFVVEKEYHSIRRAQYNSTGKSYHAVSLREAIWKGITTDVPLGWREKFLLLVERRELGKVFHQAAHSVEAALNYAMERSLTRYAEDVYELAKWTCERCGGEIGVRELGLCRECEEEGPYC